MATYYVRKTGNDSNAGTSAGAAWLTVDKAANTVAAGDTVYIGAGTYRELVTMDTSGSSGSIISFIGDITGTYTGDDGLVIISAHDSDDSVATRAIVLDFNGKNFVEWHNCTFVGSNSAFVIGNTAYATATAYEGVVINNCTVIATGYTWGVKFALNASTTPTASGIKITRCTIQGGLQILHDTNATAHVNTKILIDSNRILGIGGVNPLQIDRNTGTTTYSVGGITISNNFIQSAFQYGISASYIKNTTNPCVIASNVIYNQSSAAIINSSGTATAVVVRNNILGSVSTLTGVTDSGSNLIKPVLLFGGLHDHQLTSAFGYSPYLPFEPMAASGITNPAIDTGSNTYAQTYDGCGNPRIMGRPGISYVYYVDASDNAVSDPGSVWTTEANTVDGSLSTIGYTATIGSESSNYVFAGGTNAPSSGGDIVAVYARIYGNRTGSAVGKVRIYTDALAETLGTITYSNTTPAYSSWTLLTSPTGGWTWATIQALEMKCWTETAASNTGIYICEIGVKSLSVDIGAVEARTRLAKESTTIRSGTYAGNFTGAGYHDFWVPVDASSTTISVYAQYDSNYVGSKPKLEVFNIPGVADQSDTVTGSANTWEQLSVTFTPTAAGVVRVRISSQDASTNGKCFFDDMGR